MLLARRRHSVLISLLAATAFVVNSSSVSAGTLNYEIKNGDTLWRLAKKYGTSAKTIAKANGINENKVLALGKIIKIPSNHYSTGSIQPKKSVIAQFCGTIHTTRNRVHLRMEPNTASSATAILPEGATGTAICTKGNWTKVSFGDGTTGYIYSKLLASGDGSIQYNTSSPVAKNASAAVKPETAESNLIQTALNLRGSHYVSGGTSRGGFDCSGFTRYVFAKHGVSLPHSSAAQSNLGQPISRGSLQAGDLIFFSTNGRRIGHVGIYIGNSRFVHAARYGRGVTVDSINSSYYSSRYRGARRMT